MSFKLTEKQKFANEILASNAEHVMLFGGGRSGKTFLLCRAIAIRAIKAARSRHAILRFRFNHVKNSVVLDTWPKMMELCFPHIEYTISKSDWYCEFTGNGSQVWFGGLDDKERTEKILGMEFVTIYLNECSQIHQSSREMVITRLAQNVEQKIIGALPTELPTKMYYDCNPPSKSHWSYKLFIKKIDLDTKKLLDNPDDYAHFQINPIDNQQNLSKKYLNTLKKLSARARKRFLDGEFSDEVDNALFSDITIEKWRVLDGKIPEFVRVVVAVDPSGSGDTDNAHNDSIGICGAGLGIDGNAYLLEDCTVKAGPATWGRVATTLYDKLEADCIVGEANYGGAMVQHVIQTSNPRVPYKAVTATRGKHVRAEPISALYENGRVRHVGHFPELEDELTAFTVNGYLGGDSPNRADSAIWCISELFQGIVKEKKARPRVPHYGAIDLGVGI